MNDDIKLIPGALKSPGAHVTHQVGPPTKPRPHSSFIYRPSLPLSPVTPKPPTKTGSQSSDASTLGPSSSISSPSSRVYPNTREDSPPLPPPPPFPIVGGAIAGIEDDSQSASSTTEASVFQFPPPPSLCQPQTSTGNGTRMGGEYVQIKKPKIKGSRGDQPSASPQVAGRGRGGGGRGGRKLFGAGT